MLDPGAPALQDRAAPSADDLARLAAEAGIGSVHLLARRDLADEESGGSEVHLARVAERWAAAGIDVTMRTAHAPGSPGSDWRDGYRVVRRGGQFGVFPGTVVDELAGRDGRPDALVEVWNGVPYLSPVWFRGPRAVLLHHVHEEMWDLVLAQRSLAAMGRMLELRIAPPLYRDVPVIALCESARQQIVRRLGLPAANISVALPGVDARFAPAATATRSAHPLVVAVGRLMPPKRFDVLIEVADRLRRRHADLELVIAGEGYERDRLEAMIAERGASSWISLPGRVDDDELISLYRRAWVVAATSIAEGWGLTLTEAAACGTPSVATRISGHADAVDEGVSGLLASDERELLALLDAVLADRELRASLSEGARARAARLTWDATAWDVLEPLASQGRTSRARRR